MLYELSGRVVKGDSYGRTIGFPTVNLVSSTKDLPKDGVYAGMGILDGKEYRAGIVIGPNDKIEAHLIGYSGDAYGKEVTLKINKFLRGYRKFGTEAELKKQIEKDLQMC